MEAPRRPNSQLQAGAEVPGVPSISCSVAKWKVPSPSDPRPTCFILYKAFSPDGSCWEVRAPSKVVSSSSSNPLYQRDEA